MKKCINTISASLKLFCLILIIVFSSLLLTSCDNEKMVSVDTVLSINSAFSGSRTVSCTFSENYSNESEFSTFLDTYIQENCPNQMSYQKIINDGKLAYVFKIDFSSLSDYNDKINYIIGSKKNIFYSKQSSIFTNGIFFQEDFDSLNLIEWFYPCGDNFACRDTKVYINGEKTNTGSKIEISNVLQCVPVEKITFETVNNGDLTFNRNILVEIPNSSVDKINNDISSYMNARRIGYTSFLIEKQDKNTLLKVIFPAMTFENMTKQTNLFMNSMVGDISYTKDTDIKNIFTNEKVFSENLDLSGYCGNDFSAVYIDYVYSVKGDSDLLNADFNGKKGKLDKNTIKFTENNSRFVNINIYDGEVYTLNSINMSVSINDNDNFTKDIALIFDQNNSDAVIYVKDILLNYINENNIRVNKNGDYSELHIIASGNSHQINSVFSALSESNKLSYQVDNSGLRLTDKTILTDCVDLSKIYDNISYTPKIKYNLLTRLGEINEVSYSNEQMDNPVKISLKDKNKTSFEFTSSINSIECISKKPNYFGFLLVVILAILLCSVTMYIMYQIKRKTE